jgi:hypothetical protein
MLPDVLQQWGPAPKRLLAAASLQAQQKYCHTDLTAWFSGEAHWESLLEHDVCF